MLQPINLGQVIVTTCNRRAGKSKVQTNILAKKQFILFFSQQIARHCQFNGKLLKDFFHVNQRSQGSAKSEELCHIEPSLLRIEVSYIFHHF